MQRRPKGTYRAITAPWQARVVEELEARGWTQKRLAKELKCSEGAITGMLKPGAQTSRLVDAASALLKIAPPEYLDDIDQRDVDLLRELRSADREAYDKVVQRIARDLAAARDRNSGRSRNS